MTTLGPYIVEDTPATKPKEAVLVGRFQPFTAGHLKAYNEVKRHYHKVAVAMVVRNSGKMDHDNPLTPDQREHLIKKAIPGVTVYRVSSAYWKTMYKEIGHPVVIAIGKDREEGMSKEMTPEGPFLFVVARSDEDISATKVRNAIRNDDFKTFKEMMPPRTHSEWESLREILA